MNKKKTRQRLEELPPEIRGKIEEAIQETISNILTTIATTGKTRIRAERQEAKREELERILGDMLRLDPEKLGEYMRDREFIGAMISALYYIKKIAATRPTSIDSKLILMYFRTIDAIAATLIEMIKNAKEIILERTIQIKQAAIMKEDPIKELDRLETILIMLDGLRKHIRNIIDDM